MLIRLIENLNEAPIEPEDMPWASPMSDKAKNIWRGSHQAGLGGDNNSEFETGTAMLTRREYRQRVSDITGDVYRELGLSPEANLTPEDEARVGALQKQWADSDAVTHGYRGIVADDGRRIVRWFDGSDPHKKKVTPA